MFVLRFGAFSTLIIFSKRKKWLQIVLITSNTIPLISRGEFSFVCEERLTLTKIDPHEN